MIIKPTLQLAFHLWSQLPFYSLKMAFRRTELKIEKINWIKVIRSLRGPMYIVNFDQNDFQCEIIVPESYKDQIENTVSDVIETNRKELSKEFFQKMKRNLRTHWRRSPSFIYVLLTIVMVEVLLQIPHSYFAPQLQDCNTECVNALARTTKIIFFIFGQLALGFAIAILYYWKATQWSKVANMCRASQTEAFLLGVVILFLSVNTFNYWQTKNLTPMASVYYQIYTKQISMSEARHQLNHYYSTRQPTALTSTDKAE